MAYPDPNSPCPTCGYQPGENPKPILPTTPPPPPPPDAWAKMNEEQRRQAHLYLLDAGDALDPEVLAAIEQRLGLE